MSMLDTTIQWNCFMLISTSRLNTLISTICDEFKKEFFSLITLESCQLRLVNSHQFCLPLLAPPPSECCHLVLSVDPRRQQSSQCHSGRLAQLCRTCICERAKADKPSVSQHYHNIITFLNYRFK